MLIIGVATTLLLVLNILLVGAFIQVNREWFLNPYADETVQFRLAQAAQIFIPVILTFMEFWIFDRIVDRAFGYTKRGKGEFSETDKSNDFVR